MWSPGSPPDSLPAAPQLSGELRPRQAVTRLKEGEIAVHLLAREVLPCPCEFQERAARSGEPSHDLAEALSLPLKGSQGSVRIFGEGHGLHGHLCVLISTHVYECSAVIVRLARPFPRTASTVRETIVENASSTPWQVRALVRNIGAAGNSFRSQAVSSGPIAIESARSILLNAMPTGTGPAIFVMTSIQSL